MKRFILFAFLFLIAVLIIGCKFENIGIEEHNKNVNTTGNVDITPKKTPEIPQNIAEAFKNDTYVGNINGNIANYGIAAKDGEWIYFSSEEEGLCKMKEDGTSKMLILPDKSITYVNVVDDYIYYTSLTNGSKLYKIKTDGTGIKMLSENYVSDVYVVDDWIYFINKVADEYKICKMKTDGSELSEMSTGGASVMVFFDDKIFYIQREDGEKINEYSVYRMNSDGTNITKIHDGDIHNFIIDGGWIYYIDMDNDSNIYKMRLDGSCKTKINSDKSSYINIVDEWIYYVNFVDFDNNALYKIKTDGSYRTKVVDVTEASMVALNIIDDWIYYIKVHFLGATYRMKIDGSENIRLSINNYDTSWKAREKELSGN